MLACYQNGVSWARRPPLLSFLLRAGSRHQSTLRAKMKNRERTRKVVAYTTGAEQTGIPNFHPGQN